MGALLAASRLIDSLNAAIGRAAKWLVLAAVLVSSGNATIRYALDRSSNAWLELQWYLYAAVFLFCAAYTLQRDEHIRIDILTGRLPPRTRAWIDLLGGLFFLLPVAILFMVLSWPMFLDSFARHETSSDAGGLLRWPVKVMIPASFFLLTLQGVSEIIKRAAFLAGRIPDPLGRPVAEAEAAPAGRHGPLDSTVAEDHAA